MNHASTTSDGARHIDAFIDALAERHRRLARLTLLTRAALVVALIWLAALGVWFLVARESTAAQTMLVAGALAASVAAAVLAWRQQGEPPTRARLARLAEDRLSGLDDRLVTAVDVLERPSQVADGPLTQLLLDDTARRVTRDDVELVIPSVTVRAATYRAAAAVGLLAVLAVVAREPVGRASRAVRLWAFPERLALEVSPGDARVRPGVAFTVGATTSEAARGLVPDITVRMQEATRTARMKVRPDGAFSFGFESVPRSFAYQVQVAGHASREFQVTLLEPPRIGRIDLSYVYPGFARIAPRTESDGGDIYAPEGSRVTLRVTPKTTTAPVATAAIVLRDGREVPLVADGAVFIGEMQIADDTAYRVRLRDADGLENAEDPEYFVRRLDDRPPDVRIIRPAGDKRVTPLEEVTIEARADDDHGLDRLELVVGVRGSSEQAVPLGSGGGLSITGRHTVYLEDLDVKPGDFVSFYARARDVGRGKRPTESRSDIFFLEVTPFVDEFAMAQSQAMAGASGQQVDDLVRQQKDIIVGTWKLQRRAAGANARPSAADVKTLGRAQSALRRRVETAGRHAQMPGGGGRRGRPGAVIGGSGEEQPALLAAAGAMARAERSLDAVRPNDALPSEMEALNHLLRAEAEIQRREIARQQANSNGGGSNRNQQDISSLFDRELQRQQETNYETPQSVEERKADARDELLEKVRALARRQEALARQQDDLARDRQQMNQDEVRRRLERLTRDQSELRRQAEQLAQRMQQQARQMGKQGESGKSGERGESGKQGEQGKQAQGQSSGQSGAQAGAQALREASEDMRAAASDLRREAPDAARQRSQRALDRLQSVERGLREAGPDQQRRAAGDAQLEARELADRQRQLADDTAKAGAAAPDDARRRLADEQQRLAERADALNERVQRLEQGETNDRRARERMAEAARAAQRGKLGQQMREIAEGVRKGDAKVAGGEPQRAVARELDRLADKVGGTSAPGGDREGKQLADDLSKARELRDRLADLQRQIEAAGKQGESGESGKRGESGKQGERGQQGASGKSGGPGGQGGSGEGGQRRLAELQREYLEQLRNAGELAERLEQASPGTGRAMSTPIDQQMVTSAPGTQAFKQDFSKWETLHKDIALGLERLEVALSQRVVERAARERLRTGATDRVPDTYRSTVDRYYRALAQEPR
ncbi:MAG: hypothetical protein JJE40_09165 [Vicinamibacteria bacterium]|nr:hypothetical protein [Vicinamibacteria bacterium]